MSHTVGRKKQFPELILNKQNFIIIHNIRFKINKTFFYHRGGGAVG
jgi:hypothetical protein